jgi:hypothetical protein
MRTPITFLDRLRARLTGRPAQAYANRRLARADLHALEEHRARAVRKLNEDIGILDRYVNPLERYLDGDRILTPFGTILDRRSGKNLPLVWTELDLREFRRWARIVCDVNPFAAGFLGLLTDFHIRQGFGWQAASSLVTRHLSFGKTAGADDRASSRRTRDEGPRTPKDEADDQQQRAIIRCQQVLDEWRATNNWGLRSREAFRRWRRDGEVFLRFFLGGEETWGLPQVRFVEPEQVGPPPGEDADGDWAFGVLTETEDVETVKAYFVRDPLGSGDEGDEVPAERVLHLKANVDSSIKRGLLDFLPVQIDLEHARRLLCNMGEVAAVQSAIASMRW